MPNINQVNPADITAQPQTAAPNAPDQETQAPVGNILQTNPQDIQNQQDYNDEKYGSAGQQLLTVGEGLGQGFAGPVATGIEAALTKLGVPGLSPAEQAARAETNPGEHFGSEAVGFGAGAFTGTGEAALLGKIGEAAAGAADLGKIASMGIRGGAELAALQTGDEASKFINQDPNQTLGSAAINIGLSGLMGGAGGVALGGVSSLFKAGANQLQVAKFINDFKGETQFLQANPDMVGGATQELEGRMAEADNMRSVMSEAKPELIAQAVPEVTDNSAAKINDQMQDIDSKVSQTLNSASESVKTKAAVPFLNEDYNEWQKTVTDPNASFADKFLATNKLKQNLESYAKWGLTEEGSAKAALGRQLSNEIRPMLEDSSVWGAAGKVQKVTNAATSAAIKANEDLLPKVTSKLMGDREIDPNKLQTYFNQVEKGKAGLKSNVIRNYLDTTQDLADKINQVHIENGLEAPLGSSLNPTPVLDHSLNTPMSPGRAIAGVLKNKGGTYLANALGDTAGGGIGALAGSLVGHPLAGAWAGEKILSPTISQLAKPFAEQATNALAARASVDYLGNALKGQEVLTSATKAFFRSGEVIPKNFLPDEDSRNKLKKSLASLDTPQNIMNVGGQIGHYLPQHATAAASLAATAKNYLGSLEPKQVAVNPFDKVPPTDKAELTKYNRQLDIAQQPLLVLQHTKNGTLLPQDVATIQTLYPGLHSAMIQKLNNEMIEHKTAGKQIPYAQRVSLSLLMGSSPLDSSMSPSNMISIMKSAGPQQAQQQAGPQKQKPATGVMLKQINKTNELYATPMEARQENKRS
jgi:hypothetical protein